MMKYLKNLKSVIKPPKLNRIWTQTSDSTGIRSVKKRVYRQAALTVMTIVLTVVILFAMTSAWYTNVVQTSGLTFEAESWGFEGNITLESGSIPAAPGDEGIIDLTVENDNDSVSAISVNVSKNAMDEEMKKRLFFYVDARMSRNNEIMERVYLNRYEGYTYNVFNNSSLILREDYNNAPVIKWEWVYDVLGYYVMGEPYTVTVTGEDGNTSDIQKMNIKEYLRPIIYDFDEATTLINTEGENITIELETIDGETTPEAFLAELSTKDGYEGVIDESADPVFDNYYAVDVDESGYGVYVYLCNYSQIQEASRYDTSLGELAKSETLTEEDLKKLQCGVTVSLSAQKNDDVVVAIDTMNALKDEIAAGTADVIRLDSNIILPEDETILVPEGRRVMVDLNGHVVTSTDGTAITAQQGSLLTLMNGTLQQADQSGVTDPASTYGVRAIGSEVVMSKLQINGFTYGVYVGDNIDKNELDSRVQIKDSTIVAENWAAFISGNGFLSDQKSQLIIENSSLSAKSIVISGNGDASGNGRWGTDIQIIGSTIKGIEGGSGIYQPQKNSTLMVKDSTVEGNTGITLKGGSASLYGSRIVGTGVHEAPSFEGSGFSETGDAVYIETNYGYEIRLYISADTILEVTDKNSLPWRVFEENAAHVLVEIEEQNNENTEGD